ncbi:putative creatinase/aminopeptidase [Plasmopara halstedii]
MRCEPLVPGMVVTVEPGIYLPENDFDLPKEFSRSPNLALRSRHRKCLKN